MVEGANGLPEDIIQGKVKARFLSEALVDELKGKPSHVTTVLENHRFTGN